MYNELTEREKSRLKRRDVKSIERMIWARKSNFGDRENKTVRHYFSKQFKKGDLICFWSHAKQRSICARFLDITRLGHLVYEEVVHVKCGNGLIMAGDESRFERKERLKVNMRSLLHVCTFEYGKPFEPLKPVTQWAWKEE